jgi:hypothetical protein
MMPQQRTFAASLLLAFFCQCGFLSNPRVSKEYLEHAVADDEATCLVTWPIHIVGLPAAALVDQTIRTFEILPDAGRDAADFFLLRGDGNNIILERTVAAPKAIVSPLVFVGSYVARWFYPFGEDDRPFYDQRDDAYEDALPEPAPVPRAEEPPAPER